MKKESVFLCIIGLFFLMAGCGPSEAEYQQVRDENQRLKTELEEIRKENETLQDSLYEYYKNERPMLLARIEALEAQRSTTTTASAQTPTPAPEPETADVETESNNTEVRTSTGRGYYTVRRGDTVNGIATKLNVSKSELMRINNIRNEARIYAGQRLKLPSGTSRRSQSRPQPSPRPASQPTPQPPPRVASPTPEPSPRPTTTISGARITFYYVRPHDTLPRISAKTGVAVETLKRLNDIDENTPLRVGQRLFLR